MTLKKFAGAIIVIILFMGLFAEFFSHSVPILVIHSSGWSAPAWSGDSDWEEKELKLAIWPLAAWDAFESDETLERYPAPPSPLHWMGVDDRGRDVFARLIYGLRVSFAFALASWIGSFLIGIFLGAIQGFFGGWVDLVIQRFTELVVGLPALPLLMVGVGFIGAGFWWLLILVWFLGWVNISYIIRAEVLHLRQSAFVESSLSLGASKIRVIVRHILPQCMLSVVTYSPLVIAGYIYTLTALDYLGVGLSAPTPSWGEILRQGFRHLDSAWWLLFFPSFGLFLIMLSLSVVGQGAYFKNR